MCRVDTAEEIITISLSFTEDDFDRLLILNIHLFLCQTLNWCGYMGTEGRWGWVLHVYKINQSKPTSLFSPLITVPYSLLSVCSTEPELPWND